ncbi:HAD-IIIC family phosphatase, partial [Nitrospinaceae bacterium]|nr:HAD-IIIC family phosphatase [Nitrospinaceae bacterium]
MNNDEIRAILISDFNMDIFSGYLKNNSQSPSITPLIAPFGQVTQVLMDDSIECWKQVRDLAIVWTRPEGVINSFRKALEFDAVTIKQLIEDVDAYSDSLARLTERVKILFIPTWTLPAGMAGYGILERKPGMGLSDLLARMNLRLAENMEKFSDTFVIDADRWVQFAGQEAFNPKLWYMGKVPFGNPVFKQAVSEIKFALTGLLGGAKKIIFVDLDDTLWGGSVGEVGWQNLKLGGHDPVGEAFSDFQRALKSLTRRGILLGIVSKNEEKVALEAIEKNPEMILKREDFVGWRINWFDKARNIADLIKELKLGTQSAVFIDDNPVERARIAEALPEVLVPDWPKDKMYYKRCLMSLNCFNTPTISLEDSERTKMYQAESHRIELKKTLVSLDDWLKTLETKVIVEEIDEANCQRASQLFNKTNQMNLSTRRMTEAELVDWIKKENRHIWVFSVLDKFGDSGLTGLVGVECNGNKIQVTDFLLSCRVMGRKIEELMLHIVSEYGRSLNFKILTACYLATEKNYPCYTFW